MITQPFQEIRYQHNSNAKVKGLLFNNAQESFHVGQDIQQSNLRQSNIYSSQYFSVQQQTDILYTLESYCRVTKMSWEKLMEKLSLFFVQYQQKKQQGEKENFNELKQCQTENKELKNQIKNFKQDFDDLKEKQQKNLQELEQNLLEISGLYEQKIQELIKEQKQPKVLKSKLLNSNVSRQQESKSYQQQHDENFYELISTVKQLNETLIKENKYLKQQLEYFQDLKDPEKLITKEKLDDLVWKYQNKMKDYRNEINQFENLIKRFSIDIQRLSAFYQEDSVNEKPSEKSFMLQKSEIENQQLIQSENIIESKSDLSGDTDSIELEINKEILNQKIKNLFRKVPYINQLKFLIIYVQQYLNQLIYKQIQWSKKGKKPQKEKHKKQKKIQQLL